MEVRSEETVVHIAGHLPPPSRSCNRSRSTSEVTLRLTNAREGSSKAWMVVLTQASVKALVTLIVKKMS